MRAGRRRSPSPSCAGCADHEPENARAHRRAVCLPHDWLTWKLAGSSDLAALVTDRSDAQRHRLLVGRRPGATAPTCWSSRFGSVAAAATRAGPAGAAAAPPAGAVLGAGAGDNAAAALGLGAGEGDVVVSIGTSGVVSAVAEHADRRRRPAPSPGFADATGRFLPLVCTLNAARVLDAAARHARRRPRRAVRGWRCRRPPGADGLVLVPYLEGERTPNQPDATGALHGLTPGHRHPPRTWPGPRSRACSAGSPTAWTPCVAPGAPVRAGAPGRRRGRVRGGTRIAPAVLGRARSTCRRRASTSPTAPPARPPGSAGSATPPVWDRAGTRRYEAAPVPHVRARYAEARGHHLDRPG